MYKKNDDHFEKSKMPATGQATAAHSKWEEFRSSFHPENPKTPTQAMEQQHNHARSQLDALVRARRDRNPDAWLRAIQQNAAQFNIPTELHVPLVLGEVYNQTLQTSVTCAARAKEGVLSSAGASSLESASAPTSAGASSSEGAPASSIGIKRKRAAATPVLMPDVPMSVSEKVQNVIKEEATDEEKKDLSEIMRVIMEQSRQITKNMAEDAKADEQILKPVAVKPDRIKETPIQPITILSPVGQSDCFKSTGLSRLR